MGRQIFALVADALSVALYGYASRFLLDRLQQKGVGNAVLIGLLYLLFCASVYLLMRMPPTGAPRDPEPGIFAFATAWCFAVLVAAMIGGAGGLGGWLDRLPGGGASLSAWLVLSLVVVGFVIVSAYPLALWAGLSEAPLAAGRSAQAIELLALVGVNLMIVLTAVQWEAFFGPSEPYTGLTWRAKALIFTLFWLVFLIFVSAPRLVFLVRRPGWPAAVTFLFGTGYFVWRSLSRSAWVP